MNSRIPARVAGLVVAIVIAIAVFGCSKKAGIQALIPNKAPTVLITSAPIDTRDTASYSVQISWSGDDPDGRVDHFEYAIDPGDAPPRWQLTRKNDTTFTFSSRTPYQDHMTTWKGESPHTFLIKAVDNQGMESAIQTRSFFSSTVAPTVSIIAPTPSRLLTAKLTPSMTVTWQGTDVDGYLVGKNKPIKYKYRRFENPNPEMAWDVVKNKPDSLRKYYAARNFAGWDSVGGDTTTVQVSGQTVGHEFIFVVVAFDTAGAYSPVFSLDTNMLWYEVGYAATLGPTIRAFNESFDFEMPSGGYTPINPLSWFNLEVFSENQQTINWFATPPPGAAIESYRWRLDGDVGDETPRTNEQTDWYHWSAGAVGTTSCTIGPFTPGIAVFLYIEATDNNGLKSLMTIVLHPVKPSLDHELLIVNDTRFDTDQFDGTGHLNPYVGTWPATAELDTFLFARGGVPWRQTQVTSPPQFTRPGIFAGYNYDTLGTRNGIVIQANGVALSLIGKYKHLVWMVDANSAVYSQPAFEQQPEGTLQWMCTKNHLNTLGSYIGAGGLVWLLGGDAAFASLEHYNAVAPNNNDLTYGAGYTIFSNDKNELVPGRLMFDSAHWQNEMAVEKVPITSTSLVKARGVPTQPWVSPGWNFSHTIHSPDYSKLPARMNRKALALGDTLPPTRPTASQFYTALPFDVEYLTQPNHIVEDINPDPFITVETSTLDSLMDVRGSSIAPEKVIGTQKPTMTYYHGTNTPEFVFSGFDIWRWSRADDVTLVDFVLHEIWGLNRTAQQPAARPLLAHYPAKSGPAARPSGAASRLPVARTAGR